MKCSMMFLFHVAKLYLDACMIVYPEPSAAVKLILPLIVTQLDTGFGDEINWKTKDNGFSVRLSEEKDTNIMCEEKWGGL